MNYYKHHIGDYAKKTAHLSVMEHGAYLLMLHAYYGTEKALPMGEVLYRMLRAQSKAERAAVDSVASQFWTVTDAGLINGRAFQEIKHAEESAKTSRQNGSQGGRPKKPGGLLEKNPSGYETEPGSKPIHDPVANNHEPNTHNPDSEPPAAARVRGNGKSRQKTAWTPPTEEELLGAEPTGDTHATG